MYNDLDRALLSLSPASFVRLTRDVIADIPEFDNVQIVDGPGDRGKDIVADYSRPDPANVTKKHQIYRIECKRYSGKIGVDDIKDKLLWAAAASDLDVLVIASNAQFAAPARDLIDGFGKKNKNFEILDWTADTYKKIVRKHPAILRQYFPDLDIQPDKSPALVKAHNDEFAETYKERTTRSVSFNLRDMTIQEAKNEINQIPDLSVRSLAYRTVGDGLLLVGRYLEAKDAYSLSLQFVPNNTPVLVNQAFCFEKLKKYDSSEKCYETILVSDPHNKFALNGTGHLLFRRKKYKSAKYYFDQAIKYDPHFVIARDNKATALWAMDKHKEAFECLNETIASEGMPISTIEKKAALLSQIYCYDGALVNIEKALVHYPNNAILINSKGHYLERLGKKDEALVVFRDLLQAAPQFGQVIVNYAVCLNREGNHTEAAKLLEDATKIDPENPHLWITKSNVALAQNDLPTAKEYSDKAIQLSVGTEQQKHAYLTRAKYFEQINDAKSAVRDLISATKIDCSFMEAWGGLARITKSDGALGNSKKYQLNMEKTEKQFNQIIQELRDLI